MGCAVRACFTVFIGVNQTKPLCWCTPDRMGRGVMLSEMRAPMLNILFVCGVLTSMMIVWVKQVSDIYTLDLKL